MQQPMAKFLFNPSVMTFTTTVPDIPPSEGIQKICGFTRGLSFHRVDYKPYWHISNSIVLGCNRSSQASWVRLHLYAYVDGKNVQKDLGMFEAGTKVFCRMKWKRDIATIHVNGGGAHVSELILVPKTLPIGWFLNNYAEIDNTNNKTPFHCQVEDLRVNGRVVKI